jgi:hypothetical protein
MKLYHAAALALVSWYALVRELHRWGIDLPLIVGFATSVPLAIVVGNSFVPFMIRRARWRELLLTAKMVGDLERIIYIFGVVENQYSLIAGWLVLKGFLGWIPRSEPEPLPRYHAYLIGNGYSLVVGVGFGVFAQFVAAVLSAPN